MTGCSAATTCAELDTPRAAGWSSATDDTVGHVDGQLQRNQRAVGMPDDMGRVPADVIHQPGADGGILGDGEVAVSALVSPRRRRYVKVENALKCSTSGRYHETNGLACTRTTAPPRLGAAYVSSTSSNSKRSTAPSNST